MRKKGRSASREKSRSPSSSSQSNQPKINIERNQVTILKGKDKHCSMSLHRAELTSIITKTTFSDDFPIEPRFKDGVLDEINAEGFTPKQFSSSTKENKFKNIVIDISSDTIQMPPVSNISIGSESIFHTSVGLFSFSFKR